MNSIFSQFHNNQQYLVRMEQFGLHITGSPELFVGCAQIKITGGGSGSPNKVAIPGYITNDGSFYYYYYRYFCLDTKKL